MKIFSAKQIKEWDLFTIREQNIVSIELMERAAIACFDWLIKNNLTNRPIKVFCGKGNNGGDGLALVRILLENKIPVTAYILETGKPGTGDFQINLQRLHHLTNDIHFLQSEYFFPLIEKNDLVIDAMFGTGLNKPLDGNARLLAEHINKCKAMVVSMDVPSGLFIDKNTKGETAIHATHTLSFQQLKLAFLMPENNLFTGDLHLLNIGLSEKFETLENACYETTDPYIIEQIIRPLNKFAHKGNLGHAALFTGSFGMMGAGVLAARACLYSGVGKLTCHIPICGYHILQTSVPEAMCHVAGEEHLETLELTATYNAIGIGPGIGVKKETQQLLKNLLRKVSVPLVLDADALNMLAADRELLNLIPKGSVITPHIKEFERLFGSVENDFQRLEIALNKAAELNIYIVLKGHYTAIITPANKIYFNTTGNAGMAKAGMGDVLTGMITGFLSQQYSLPEAAMLAVYLHGLAGDIASAKFSPQAMQASYLLDCISKAWIILNKK